MSKLVCECKVKEYREFLKYRFWTDSEISILFSGMTEFGMRYNIPSSLVISFGRDHFKLLPKNVFDDDSDIREIEASKNTHIIVEKMVEAIESGKLQACSMQMIGTRFLSRKSGVMYYLEPDKAIAFAVTNGFNLPKELQKAADHYQIETGSKTRTAPQIKEIKREALAHAFWYKYPDSSISEINRKLQKLRDHPGYKYIHQSEKRSREVVRKLQLIGSKESLCFPGSIEICEGNVLFDFQKISVAVETIAGLLIDADINITQEQIMNHPLIRCYIDTGGEVVKKIIYFSLQETFMILYFSQNPPQE